MGHGLGYGSGGKLHPYPRGEETVKEHQEYVDDMRRSAMMSARNA